MERVALAGDVRDRLHGNGVRAGAQLGEDPIPGALVRRGVGDARPELHLLLQVRERVAAIELARHAAGAAARLTGDEQDKRQTPPPPPPHCFAPHWICPTLAWR